MFAGVARTGTRRLLPSRRAAAIGPVLLASLLSCTSVDPGPNFVVPNVTFNSDYFYCVVEPRIIFAYKCGPGDPSGHSSTDTGSNCHFNPSAVSGMALQMHPAINCGGGDHPVDLTQTGSGSPAAENYQAVSFEMSTDYTTAPVFVRPSGNSHPRAVFSMSDPTVNQILATWAVK